MKILNFLRLVKSYLNGDFAYQNYLTHHHKNHPNQPTLNKKEFILKQQREKWSKVNRCC